jgi:hypothetical protein
MPDLDDIEIHYSVNVIVTLCSIVFGIASLSWIERIRMFMLFVLVCVFFMGSQLKGMHVYMMLFMSILFVASCSQKPAHNCAACWQNATTCLALVKKGRSMNQTIKNMHEHIEKKDQRIINLRNALNMAIEEELKRQKQDLKKCQADETHDSMDEACAQQN